MKYISASKNWAEFCIKLNLNFFYKITSETFQTIIIEYLRYKIHLFISKKPETDWVNDYIVTVLFIWWLLGIHKILSQPNKDNLSFPKRLSKWAFPASRQQFSCNQNLSFRPFKLSSPFGSFKRGLSFSNWLQCYTSKINRNVETQKSLTNVKNIIFVGSTWRKIA